MELLCFCQCSCIHFSCYRFAASKKWKFEILNMSKSDQGGIKVPLSSILKVSSKISVVFATSFNFFLLQEAAVSVSGSGVYGIMKVHM